MTELTNEQQQVIEHPDGLHGKVLAVAGSGKTTTMAYRIKHLLQEHQVASHQIQVLMFNRYAREQFIEKLTEIGVSEGQQPPVQTFHGYSYGVINTLGYRTWIGDSEGLAHLALKKAISQVCRTKRLDEDEIDVAEAGLAIGLWKGTLTPPSQAGYHGEGGDNYIAVYKEYEEIRLSDNAITYDDFVPLALSALEKDNLSRQSTSNKLRYIIVDEYQDVNFGQQKLIEFLARDGADIMVVGDDDQTIYEWRGARSDFILGGFENVFDNKRHRAYTLTNSFRFGYSIAQSSYNVILHNASRYNKDLITNDPADDSKVTLITDREDQGESANRLLAEEIVSLVKDKGVAPSEIRVLGRTYSQLNSISMEFLTKQIPFKVIGRAPFLQEGECQALLNYVRLGASMNEVLNSAASQQFLGVANKPRRFLLRRDVERMLNSGQQREMSLGDLLWETIQDKSQFSRGTAKENLEDLTSILEDIHRRLHRDGKLAPASQILEWIDKEVGFRQHYSDYYGHDVEALSRMETVKAFISYAKWIELDWIQFIGHVDNTDTTLGRPDHECIKMSTIHSVKGLEFKYVIIPDCKERHLPVIGKNDNPTYHRDDPKRTPKPSEWLENERRLFYVAATRASSEIFIGAPALLGKSEKNPEEGQDDRPKSSRFLEEMELDPTQAVAAELVRAARGDRNNKLTEVCQRFSGYHHIVTPLKTLYLQKLPTWVQEPLQSVKTTVARVFGYKQEYDDPIERTRLRPKLPEGAGGTAADMGEEQASVTFEEGVRGLLGRDISAAELRVARLLANQQDGAYYVDGEKAVRFEGDRVPYAIGQDVAAEILRRQEHIDAGIRQGEQATGELTGDQLAFARYGAQRIAINELKETDAELVALGARAAARAARTWKLAPPYHIERISRHVARTDQPRR
ncbi:MAG: ATP-dependent helicase [Chloroflexi bacterium]|nr:ATP-dependent helicase [Chloroflexota bacterium]